MASELTFDQISTVLNEIVSQATGVKAQAAVDTSSFVAQATTALKCGPDTLLQAISQVLSKTIFSSRAYTGKFASIMASNQQFGNHVRKLSPIADDFIDQDSMTLADGLSVDMYKVKKQKVLQTNFYGQQIYSKMYTYFLSQLEQAFTTPNELASYWSMILTEQNNIIESGRENLRRMTVANFMGAKFQADPGNVIHLLTEYKALIGNIEEEFNPYTPDNVAPFFQFIFARMQTVSDFMEERSKLYHMNITNKGIMRHTPKSKQKCLILSSTKNQIAARVFTNTYNESFLKYINHETVSFWQSIEKPDEINVTPSYISADGTVAKGDAQNKKNIFAVLFDEEALGVTNTYNKSRVTPVNAAGEYSNVFWHFRDRWWNDLTENGVVFCLD